MYLIQRPKIGFLLESIGPSELSYNILSQSTETEDYDVYMFWVYLDKACMNNLTPNLHYSECYGFDGPVIATNLDTANKLLMMPTPNPKYFFLNDLEWLRIPNKNYHQLEPIYRNTNLNLIARCKDHAILIENCWNRKVSHIIENYNFFGLDFIKDIPQYNRYKDRETNYKKRLTGNTNLLNI